MTNIFNFIKKKEIEINNDTLILSNIKQKIEACSSAKNISLAKAAEKLNAFQSLHIEEAISLMSQPILNKAGESGLKFVNDGSIMFKNNGRWNGLTLGDSEIWLAGKYSRGHLVSIDQSISLSITEIEPPPESIQPTDFKKGLTIKPH